MATRKFPRPAVSFGLVSFAVAVLSAIAPALAHAPDRVGASALVPPIGVPGQGAAPAVPGLADPSVTMAPASLAASCLPLLMLAAFAVVAARSRRAAVGLLIGLLALLTFETGRHSVHHLGEPRDATRCMVESLSSNLSGAIGEPTTVVGPAETADFALHREASVAPPQRERRPDRGRAPPLLV